MIINAINILLILVIIGILVKIILDYQNMKILISKSKQSVQNIDPEVVYEFAIGPFKEDYNLIDVRTAHEYFRSHIQGAMNFNIRDLKFYKLINQLDKSKKYIIYCQSNSRCQKAVDVMKRLGFSDLFIMNGGLIDWSMQDLPVVRG